MWLGILGFLLLASIMFTLLKGKISPAVAFIAFPIIAALILGYNPVEISGFIEEGVKGTTTTAVLFLFSIPFFGIMNENGVFDPLVNRLVKIAGDSYIAITITTVIIATIAHLDGSAAATALITVPAMLPIYKKLNMRPAVLVLLIAASTGVMNLVPWGGPTMRVGSIMGIDPNIIWHQLIPMQAVGLTLSIGLAIYMGIVEKRRAQKETVVYADDTEAKGKGGHETLQQLPMWKIYCNLVLIVAVVAILASGKLGASVVFMVGLAIALILNYGTLKEQTNALKRQATGVLAVVIVLLASGVLIGVFSSTNMLSAMADILLRIIPSGVGQSFNIIIGILAAPLGIVLGTDAYFFGLFPLVAEVASKFNITEMTIALTMLIGKNNVVVASPMVPATFLLLGLAGVELKDHLKFALPWLVGMSWITIIVGITLGLI